MATHAEDRVFEPRPQQTIGETDRDITSTKCLATGVNDAGPKNPYCAMPRHEHNRTAHFFTRRATPLSKGRYI